MNKKNLIIALFVSSTLGISISQPNEVQARQEVSKTIQTNDKQLEKYRTSALISTEESEPIVAQVVWSDGRKEKVIPVQRGLADGSGFVGFSPQSFAQTKTSTYSMDTSRYYYKFVSYKSSKTSRLDQYKRLGRCTFKNYNTKSVTGVYTQQSTTSVAWNVAATFSASTTIGNALVGDVTAKLDLTAGRTKTVTSGTQYSASVVVSAKKQVNIDCYQQGGSSNGTLTFTMYKRNGDSISTKSCGTYTETVSSQKVVLLNAHTIVVGSQSKL